MVTTMGTILNVGASRYLLGRRRILKMTVGHESGVLFVKWFHFNHYMIGSFRKGNLVTLSGKVRGSTHGGLMPIDDSSLTSSSSWNWP